MRRNTIWSKLLVFNPTWALILMLSESAAHQEHGSFFSQSHNPFVPSSAFVKTVKALVLFTQKTKCHPVPEPWQICLHLKVLKKKRERIKGFSCNLRRISDCFALWDAIQAAKKASNAPGRDLVRGCLMSHIDCESKGGKNKKQNKTLPQCATMTAWIPWFVFILPYSFPSSFISAGQYHVEIGQLELKPECM